MLKVVVDGGAREDAAADLDEIVREGARRMLAAALEAEVDSHLAALAGKRDVDGRRLVGRNGHARPRRVTTAAGAVEVSAPRVNDKRTDPETGERRRFRSAILPPWCRRSPKVTEVLPLLYLHGMSSGDFAPALEEFFGSSAGLSASVITRLTTGWQEEYRRFAPAGPVRSGLRVLLGGRHPLQRPARPGPGVHPGRYRGAGGRQEGAGRAVRWAPRVHRILGRSAAGLPPPRDARPDAGRRRRRTGFWAALREVFPDTREQRDWVHKVVNVLDALPTSAQPAARRALAEIRDAQDRAHAQTAITAFQRDFGVKHPKAVAKITDDAEQLLAFYDFPAEHWIHLKTSNPIESTFATVRLRTKVTKGPGSRAAGLAMVFKTDRSRPRLLARGQRPTPGRARPSRREVRERSTRRAARTGRREGRRVINSGHAIHNCAMPTMRWCTV